MKNKLMVSAALSAALFSGVSMASTDFGIGLKGGSFGAGFEAGFQFTPKIKARFQSVGLAFSYDESVDGNAYSGDLDIGGNSLLLDFHPFDGSFHLTGGIVAVDSQISGTASTSSTTSLVIGDTTYNSGQLASATFGLKPASDAGTYVGFGWGSIAHQDPGLSFNLEFGLVLMDSPKVNFSVEENVLTASEKQQLDNDIQKEITNIETEIEDFDIWPVVAVGLAYHF